MSRQQENAEDAQARRDGRRRWESSTVLHGLWWHEGSDARQGGREECALSDPKSLSPVTRKSQQLLVTPILFLFCLFWAGTELSALFHMYESGDKCSPYGRR